MGLVPRGAERLDDGQVLRRGRGPRGGGGVGEGAGENASVREGKGEKLDR